MKKTTKCFPVIACAFLLAYVSIAFVTIEPNPFEWDKQLRGLMMLISFGVLFLWAASPKK